MSRANYSFIFCAFVAFVGSVAAQSFDPNQCSANVQSAASDYQKQVSSLLGKFAQDLTSRGLSAYQTDKLNQDINKLTNSISQLTDISGGFDTQKYMATLSQIASTQVSLASYAVQPELALDSFRLYARLLTDLTSAYSNFITRVPTGCVPTSKRGPRY